MSRKRLKPDDRKGQILQAAIQVASAPGGWSRLTREAVAREASCAEGLVSNYFGTMICFRRTIMRAAIANEVLPVIAQGLASGDTSASKAAPELKRRALELLAG